MGTIRIVTSRKSSSAYRSSRPVALKNFCRIAGGPAPVTSVNDQKESSPADARSIDGLSGLLVGAGRKALVVWQLACLSGAGHHAACVDLAHRTHRVAQA